MAFQRSLLACVLLVSGCSLAIQGPDPLRPRTEVPKCDTGKGAVGMDGLMVALFGLASLATFAAEEEGAGLALGATSGLFLASAMRGNNAANECRAAYDEYNVAMQAQRRHVAEELPRPRPVAVKKKPTKPPPVADPVAIEPAPAEEPLQPTIPPPYATPRPAVTTEPSKKKPAPPPKPADGDDDWSSFWKEAP